MTDSNPVELTSCRACSSNFTYVPKDGGPITILVGIPPQGATYKALSHVWGPYNLVEMRCETCHSNFDIRWRSKDTFLRAMELAGSGNKIWIDNMSINQDDPSDVSQQVAVMGDIYGNAQSVAVLLTGSDMPAYNKIAGILQIASTLLSRKGQFDYNLEDQDWDPALGEEIEATGELAKSFFEEISQLLAGVGNAHGLFKNGLEPLMWRST